MVLDPLVCSFDNLDSASNAREALLASGVKPDLVELRVIQDEAGPVEGNFLIGNGRTTHGGEPGPVLAGPEVPYERNFRETITRGVHLLMVHVSDPSVRGDAQRLLAQFGGVDPQALATAARESH